MAPLTFLTSSSPFSVNLTRIHSFYLNASAQITIQFPKSFVITFISSKLIDFDITSGTVIEVVSNQEAITLI
jgi:hypothetical protein